MFSNGAIRLFRIRGIDVFLHWSWFLVAAVEISSRQNAYTSPGWNVLEYLMLFAIVLLHEFGHALACRQVGGEAVRILLWPFGGVASIRPPQRPTAMLWSIAAGPLVNAGLLVVFLVVTATGSFIGLWSLMPNAQQFVRAVSIINVGLLVFNLLPVYPLDGGQIFRSLLWFFVGRAKSLVAASLVGFVGVAGVGLLALQAGSGWLALMGAYIGLSCWNGWQAASALLRMEKAPRRQGYHCPACNSQAIRGEFWKCSRCATAFDTFETGARCPACGAEYTVTLCLDCHVVSPFTAWKDETVMSQSISAESEPSGVKPLAEPLHSAKNWVRLVAILSIFAGVLMALTIVGIVVAWLPIWAGIALYQSTSGVQEAVMTGKVDSWTSALSKLQLYFKLAAASRIIAFAFGFFFIVVVVGIVAVSRSARTKNEASAVADVQIINAAQAKYMMSNHKYGSLQDLVIASLVDHRLLDQPAGYRLQVETQNDGYIVLASALSLGARYDYYSFADGVVRYSGDTRKAPPGLATAPVE